MLLLLCAGLVTVVCGQVATPARKVGFPYFRGQDSAKVHLEVYLDLLCQDSQEAWPHIKDVAKQYGPQQVALTVHLFPLPYHQNAFYASRAAFVIHYLSNGTKTFDWIEKILMKTIPELGDSSFHNSSDADLLQKFGQYVSGMGVNVSAFLELVDRRDNNIYEKMTRVMWKHACTRGVAETPAYFVNGIIHPNIKQNWTIANWQQFLQPLLEPVLFDEVQLPDYQSQINPGSCGHRNAGSTTPAIAPVYLIFTVISTLYMQRRRN